MPLFHLLNRARGEYCTRSADAGVHEEGGRRMEDGGALKMSRVASVIDATVCSRVGRCEIGLVCRWKDLESRAVVYDFIVF